MAYQAPVDDIMHTLKAAAGLDELIRSGVLEGVDEETARAKLGRWIQEQQKLFQAQTGAGNDQDFQTTYEKLQQAREKIVRDERTGFVWLLLQK